jgi:hypothetical protein
VFTPEQSAMNYCAVVSVGMYCLSFVFTNASHAQYVPVYDKNGNTRFSPNFRSEDVRTPTIVRPYISNVKPTAYESYADRSRKAAASNASVVNERRVNNTKYADANGLYVERSSSNNLVGYYNFKTGQQVITHSFTAYKRESEGYYGLELDKWGFLDKTGKVMIPFRYDEIHNVFTDGIAKVELAGKMFWIDKNGNEVSNEEVNRIQSAARFKMYIEVAPTADENGLRLATKKRNDKILYCYLNSENIEVIGADYYVNYLPLSEGFYAFRCSSGNNIPFWVFVDKNNKRLANAWYSSIHSTFKNGTAKVSLYVPGGGNVKEGATIWIDKEGKEVIVTAPPPPTDAQLEKARDLAYQAENLTNLHLGNKRLETKNYSEAITFYSTVIQQNVKTTMPAAYFGRGKTKLLLNEQQAACLDLKMAVTLGHSGAKELISIHCN